MIQKDEKYLKQLVEEAQSLLREEGEFYTTGNKLALTDLIEKAKIVLTGNYKCPFSRSREFVNEEETNIVSFAISRYTMAPTYLETGSVFSTYGLEEGITWFRRQDVRRFDRRILLEKCEKIINDGRSLIDNSICGEEIGQYDSLLKKELQEKISRLIKTKNTGENLEISYIKCMDAIREFRFSRVLRSEKEDTPSFIIRNQDLVQLRKKVCQDAIAKAQYKAMKKEADNITLKESFLAYQAIDQEDQYELWNKHFYIWSDTGKIVSVRTPKGTVGARLSFVLPSVDNEKQGLGHVWISDVRIECADGTQPIIQNNCFEQKQKNNEPREWSIIKQKGNPKIYIDSRKEWGYDSLYLCNPTQEDEAKVSYNHLIELKENAGYTFYFRAKVDGKLKNGLEAILEFVDIQGEKIGEFKHCFTKKSYISAGKKAMSMQCNAIVYGMEEKVEYAQKAKYDMLFFLNDFCQGAEHWLIYNSRPEGCDAYGAVQAGRILCAVASSYSLIVNADVFEKKEKQRFYEMIDYLIRYCLDMRDRTELTRERVQRNTSNWQTDMCIGTAAMMMVLPDFPHRKTWIYNAEAVLRAQLEINLNEDSSWPESIRYHHAALDHFSTFAAAWETETGEDYFETTRLTQMFEYTLHTITPPYLFFNHRIGTPPFGDHVLQDGKELHLYGLYVKRIEEISKKLADNMFATWKLAGMPVKEFSNESVVIENLLYSSEENYRLAPDYQFNLESNIEYPHSGIYIFRNFESIEKQNYLAVMSSPKPIGHGHLDQGSFILYKDNIPVIMDSGIEGYFDVSTHWHLSSYSHACLQFATKQTNIEVLKDGFINLTAGTYSLERGWVDVPKQSKVIAVEKGCEKERILMQIQNPEGEGSHLREILFYKESGCVNIKDVVSDFTGNILFSLPTLMKDAYVEKNKVRLQGYYGVDMEVTFLSPIESLKIDKGRTTPMYDEQAGQSHKLLYIRATAKSESGFAVEIKPYHR